MAARRNRTNLQSVPRRQSGGGYDNKFFEEVARQSGGGYDYKFVEEVPEKYLCNICMKVLQEPQLTDCCGQNYCASCLQTWFAQQRKKQCPQCRQENFTHIIYWPLKREINELKIRCSNYEKGCKAVVKLSELGDHLSGNKTAACKYVTVTCTNNYCGVQILRKDLKKHLDECPMRKYQCKYCDYEGTYTEITTNHYDQCTDYPVDCPNKCGVEPIKRKEVPAHKLTCSQEPVECPLSEAGCKAKLVRSELASHMAENSQQHLVDMMEAFTELRKKVGLLESHQQSLVTSLQSIRSEIDYINTKEAQAQAKHLIWLLEASSRDRYASSNISEGLTAFSRNLDSITASQKAAIECIKTQLMQPPKIVKRGDSVAFRMTNFTTWQHGRVWDSPPFYCSDDFEMCLKVNVREKMISLQLIKGDVNQLPQDFRTLKLQVLDQDLVTQPHQQYQQPSYHSYRPSRSYTCGQQPYYSDGWDYGGQDYYQREQDPYPTPEVTAHILTTHTYTDYNERLVLNDSIVVQASWTDQ